MTKSENGKGSVFNHELKDFEDIFLKLIDELPHEELDKMKTLTESGGQRKQSDVVCSLERIEGPFR